MHKINQQLAMAVVVIGCVLLLLSLITDLFQQAWFVFLMALWLFVFVSCCYRLTPLFKQRNGLDKLIQRDQKYLMCKSLTGFFDRTTGPHWFLIDTIEHIQCEQDTFYIYVANECVYSTSLPSSKAQLIDYFNSLLTAQEKQSMIID